MSNRFLARRAGELLAACVVVGIGSAAWAQQPLAGKLKAEFESRAYAARLPLGSYVVAVHPDTGQQLPRLVDTEYFPDGSVKYYVCRGFAGSVRVTDLLVKGYYASPASVAIHPPGTQLWVTKVEMKDDRIELTLSRNPAQTTARDYAKLKVMLGRGYQSSDYEKVVGVIARALKVDRFERLYALADSYLQLKVALGNAEREYQATRPDEVDARLAAATRLQQVCRSLADNRAQFAALGQTDAEGPALQARASELDAEIGRIRAAQAAARLKTFQDRCSASLATARSTGAAGRALTVASDADWQRKSDWISKYEAALEDVRKSHKALTEAGGSPPPADVQWADEEQRGLARARQDLARARGRLALAELDARFRALELRRAQLQEAYMKGFGSGQERVLLQNLASHLQEMYRNRLEAEKAGSKTAAAQAAQLLQDIKKAR